MRPTRGRPLLITVGVVLLTTAAAVVGSLVGGRGGWTALDASREGDQALTFIDVAADVGLGATHGAFRWDQSADPVAMMGGGLCWLDYDRDGWMDLFVVNTYAEAEWSRWQDAGGLPRSQLFRNVDGTFVDVTEDVGIDLVARGLGCVAADLDGDGDSDLYVTTATFNHLLLNEAGAFRSVADEAGVDGYGWQTGVAAGDVNGDGLIDLYVAGYVNLLRQDTSSTQGFPRDHEGLPDTLYLGAGVEAGIPRFEEVPLDPEMDYGLGVLLTDLDDDMDLDVYVANDTNPNTVLRNDSVSGDLALTDRVDSGANDEFSGMGASVGDLDDDGLPELAITNLDDQLHGLYSAVGDGSFVAISETSGLAALEGEYTGWGTVLADLDNDGDLDLFVVNGNVPVMHPQFDRQPLQLFLDDSDSGVAFTSAGASAGFDAIGPIIGRGAAAADFDNDGDLDIAVSRIGGQVLLLRNEGTAGHTLTVSLDRPTPGTRLELTLSSGEVLTRWVTAGGSYLSSSDPRVHFGLGDSAIVSLTVLRPGEDPEVFTEVPIDSILRVP